MLLPEILPGTAHDLFGLTAARFPDRTGALVTNYLRKPYGPGWVLVGDAGYTSRVRGAPNLGVPVLVTATDRRLL